MTNVRYENNLIEKCVYGIEYFLDMTNGEEDSYIRSEHIHQFRRINEDAKLVIIPGTSHRFLEEGAWDMVLDLTRDWFDFEQVLLM
mgnify:CR=1 FL=1